jgi:hypothetical protein
MSAAIGYCDTCGVLSVTLYDYKLMNTVMMLCPLCEVHLSWQDLVEITSDRIKKERAIFFFLLLLLYFVHEKQHRGRHIVDLVCKLSKFISVYHIAVSTLVFFGL